MKRLIYIFALLMLTFQSAKADGTGFKEMVLFWTDAMSSIFTNKHGGTSEECLSTTIYYDSYDAKKNKVRLSAKIYYYAGPSKFDRIILSCHPTVTENRATPTGYSPIDGDVKRLTHSYGYETIVVCPDYCGYGVSSHLQHPYLIGDITARNCLDAVPAAIDGMKKLGYNFEDDYKTDIVGYSQGGATALACAKYLEGSSCPKTIKDKVHYCQTACGDGPYSPVATVQQYLRWGNPNGDNKNLDYACVLPLIVMAAKEAYNEGCMRTVEVDSFFSEEFNKAKIAELIRTKSVSTGVLDKKIVEAMGNGKKRPIDVFSDKFINKTTGEFNTTTKEYKCLMRALDMADLTKGWTPTHPIYFFHLKCDKTVPYTNFEEIFSPGHIGYDNDKVKGVDPEVAFTDVPWLIRYSKDMTNINIDNISHDVGGTVFYMAYMFGDKLRLW